MSVFNVNFCIANDSETTIQDFANMIQAAIDEGFIGGNFLVTDVTLDETSFWNKWNELSNV